MRNRSNCCPRPPKCNRLHRNAPSVKGLLILSGSFQPRYELVGGDCARSPTWRAHRLFMAWYMDTPHQLAAVINQIIADTRGHQVISGRTGTPLTFSGCSFGTVSL